MDIHGDIQTQPEVVQPVGSITPPLNPQPRIKYAPPDRSLWLLPLVALMLLAGAVAIYFLPINLDLLLPLCLWVALATVLLCVFAWRTVPIVSSPLHNAERRSPNGKLITWNRFASLSSLLLAIFLATTLATSGMLGFALGKSSSYSIYGEFEQPFVLLVTASVVIILLLFLWLTRTGPIQKLAQLRFAGLGVLAIPVVIYLVLNSWLPPLLHYPSDYIGPFASWPAMVQFARHEADRIDKEAIVYYVSVFSSPSHGPYSPQSSLFDVEFEFVRPTGEGINITLLDTDPIRLVYVHTQTQPLISGYPGAHEAYADWFAYVKLGPRDVYSLTEKEAIAFAQRNDINVAGFWPRLGTSLLFSDIWSSRFGVPAVWEMHYISEDVSAGLDLDVDAATGKVLARNSFPSESTVTPTPHPAAAASPAP